MCVQNGARMFEHELCKRGESEESLYSTSGGRASQEKKGISQKREGKIMFSTTSLLLDLTFRVVTCQAWCLDVRFFVVNSCGVIRLRISDFYQKKLLTPMNNYIQSTPFDRQHK